MVEDKSRLKNGSVHSIAKVAIMTRQIEKLIFQNPNLGERKAILESIEKAKTNSLRHYEGPNVGGLITAGLLDKEGHVTEIANDIIESIKTPNGGYALSGSGSAFAVAKPGEFFSR